MSEAGRYSMHNDHWALKTAQELTRKGYRVIPAKDGRPLYKWRDGQTYLNVRYWQDANQVAIVLGKVLLVDWDNGETSLAALEAITGDNTKEATQWRTEDDRPSYHWMYAIPEHVTQDTHKHSQDGAYLPGVDLKMMNQLCYVKPDKIQNIPSIKKLKPCPGVLLEAMRRSEKEKRTRATRSGGGAGCDRLRNAYALNPAKNAAQNVRACAKASPVYWYSRLGAKIDENNRGACPSCGGDDRCLFQTDTGRWCCRVCGRAGSIIDYAVLVKQIDTARAIRGLYRAMFN